MITETHECCGVKYGEGPEAIVIEGSKHPPLFEKQCFYKLISANNKNTPNWVGVSEAEFDLSKKGFQHDV